MVTLLLSRGGKRHTLRWPVQLRLVADFHDRAGQGEQVGHQ